MFLTPDEIAILTGIKKGRDGKTREQLQHECMLRMGIPSRLNDANMPVVTWDMVNGGKPQSQPQERWIPAALRKLV